MGSYRFWLDIGLTLGFAICSGAAGMFMAVVAIGVAYQSGMATAFAALGWLLFTLLAVLMSGVRLGMTVQELL